MKRATQARAARIRVKAMTADEVRAFLAEETTSSPTGLRNKALLTLMVTTGLRVSEALGIRVRDLETNGGDIVSIRLPDTKAGVPQVVEVNDEARHLLQRWIDQRKALGIDGRSFVFCTVTEGAKTGFAKGGRVKPGQRLSRQYVYKLVRALAGRARQKGLIAEDRDVTPHSLRHTFGTEVARTKPAAVVQKALRHAAADVTNLYVHIAQADVKEAVDGLPRYTGEPPDEQPEPDVARQVLAEKVAAMEAQLAELKAALGEPPAGEAHPVSQGVPRRRPGPQERERGRR